MLERLGTVPGDERIPSLPALYRHLKVGLDEGWLQIQPGGGTPGRPNQVYRDTSPTRATMILLTLFGALALLMAALGVYGVMSFTVGRRTREMGIRQAFGAGGGNILNMVLRDSLFLVIPGVAVGLLGALLLRRVLASLLYGVSPSQPMALASVSAVIVLVAIAAAWLPARRASRVDPMVALRAE